MQKKTKKSDDKLRVLIAVTEASPLSALWRAAMNLMSESPAEVMALFVDDNRWRRAASLPFTREISRVSGAAADFTVQRAEQLNKEAIKRTLQHIEKLASQADLSFAFEVLPESDQKRNQGTRQCRPKHPGRAFFHNGATDLRPSDPARLPDSTH